MPSGTRSLAFLFVVSALLFFALVPRFELLEDHAVAPAPRREMRRDMLEPGRRGILDPGDDSSSSAAAPSTPTPTSATPTPTPTPTSATPTSTATPTTSTTPTSTATTPTSTPPTSNTSATPTSTPPAAPTNPGSSSTAASNPTGSTGISSASATGDLTSTVPGGQETVTVSTSGTSSSASATSTAAPPDTSSSKLSTGSIVGMAVAGGVAVIGIIGFLVWKFTRKRFNDFDDNEAIKWPELNTHNGGGENALPIAGRAGFGDDDPLTRAQSNSNRLSAYASSLATSSTPEFYQGGGGPDPYAVPPLPHLNPNGAYHDDPNYLPQDPNHFYDPYRGPVPDSVAFDGQSGMEAPQAGYGGEAIPMTQMARNRSMAYSDGGRASPAPGRQSPGPSIAMSGRQSPGPQISYGDMRHASPAPQSPYGAPGGYDQYRQ